MAPNKYETEYETKNNYVVITSSDYINFIVFCVINSAYETTLKNNVVMTYDAIKGNLIAKRDGMRFECNLNKYAATDIADKLVMLFD